MSGSVTVTIARRVAPGREADFEAWSEELTSASARFPGYLGSGLLRPSTVGQPWHTVFRFDTGEHLAAWEDAPVRRTLLESGSDFMETTDVHRISGLETWFELPGRTTPAPPKWKMFLVSVAGIFTLQLGWNLVLEPVGLPLLARRGCLGGGHGADDLVGHAARCTLAARLAVRPTPSPLTPTPAA